VEVEWNMADPATPEARLLPTAFWSQCTECDRPVPEFEFSEDFRARLEELKVRGDRVEIMKELSRASGCDLPTAKEWVFHKTYTIAPKPKAYCPDCGARLRTAKAKQCWKCKKDWH